MVIVMRHKITNLFLILFFIITQNNAMQPANIIEETEKKTSLFAPRTVTEQLMYTTVKIETNKGVGSSFRFDFQVSEDQSVPCLITNSHTIQGASFCKFIFHEADTSTNKIIPSGKNIGINIPDFSENNVIIYHPNPNIDLCAIPLQPILLLRQ